MLKQDYIMRLIMQMASMVRAIWGMPENERSKHTDDLEEAVGNAANIDAKLLLSLDPESVVQMLRVGDINNQLATYITRLLFFEAKLLEADGNLGTASLRREQAIAIARAYDCAIPAADESAEGLVQLFLEDLDEFPVEKPESPAEERPKPKIEGSLINGIPIDRLKFD